MKRVREEEEEGESKSDIFQHVVVMDVLVQYLTLQEMSRLALTCSMMSPMLRHVSIAYRQAHHLMNTPCFSRELFLYGLHTSNQPKCLELAWQYVHSPGAVACEDLHSIGLIGSHSSLSTLRFAMKFHDGSKAKKYFCEAFSGFLLSKHATYEDLISLLSTHPWKVNHPIDFLDPDRYGNLLFLCYKHKPDLAVRFHQYLDEQVFNPKNCTQQTLRSILLGAMTNDLDIVIRLVLPRFEMRGVLSEFALALMRHGIHIRFSEEEDAHVHLQNMTAFVGQTFTAVMPKVVRVLNEYANA